MSAEPLFIEAWIPVANNIYSWVVGGYTHTYSHTHTQTDTHTYRHTGAYLVYILFICILITSFSALQ